MTLRRNDNLDGNIASKDVMLNDEETALTLFKPAPLMNVLGNSVARAVRATVQNPSSLIVLQDCLTLQPGTMRHKAGGQPDGHRGVRSINKFLHVDQDRATFHRLQIGIGRAGDAQSYVLGPLSAFEKQHWSANGEGTDQVWHEIEKIARRQRALFKPVES